jgi:capsular polysaccharide biosynthesis protein
MTLKQFWTAVRARRQTILMIVLIFLVVSLVITFAQPIKYSSRLKLLVVQNVSQTSTDPYSLAASNEYLSNILAKVAISNIFFNRVMHTGFDIDQNYFSTTINKQEKIWNKTISVVPVNNTGILIVTAYHQNRAQAEQIARAVGYVLMTENQNYHGLGDNLRIKLLDEPITSKYPVKPNIILNLILALFLGFVFSLAYVYLREQKTDDYGYDEFMHEDDNSDEDYYADCEDDDCCDEHDNCCGSECNHNLYIENTDPFYQFADQVDDFDPADDLTEAEQENDLHQVDNKY